MWKTERRAMALEGREVLLVRFVRDEEVLSWEDVALLLKGSAEFREVFHRAWADQPFDFLWKPVPIHPDTVGRDFFVVLVPSAFVKADASAFRDKLEAMDPEEEALVFLNLSGSATLVVPRERGEFGHIAGFCREASRESADAFWEKAGEEALRRVQEGAVSWCNTHGHGVPWFHLRFDKTHKYSAFSPRGAISSKTQEYWFDRVYSGAF